MVLSRNNLANIDMLIDIMTEIILKDKISDFIMHSSVVLCLLSTDNDENN